MLLLAGVAVLGTLPCANIPFLGFLALLTFAATLQMAFSTFRFYQKDANISFIEKYPIAYKREFSVPSRHLSGIGIALIRYFKNNGVRIISEENKEEKLTKNQSLSLSTHTHKIKKKKKKLV